MWCEKYATYLKEIIYITVAFSFLLLFDSYYFMLALVKIFTWTVLDWLIQILSMESCCPFCQFLVLSTGSSKCVSMWLFCTTTFVLKWECTSSHLWRVSIILGGFHILSEECLTKYGNYSKIRKKWSPTLKYV